MIIYNYYELLTIDRNCKNNADLVLFRIINYYELVETNAML